MKSNFIGTAGQSGFGVGIAPHIPSGFEKLDGTLDINSHEYGNYRYKDGSVMVYVPRFNVAFKDGRVSVLSPDEDAPEGSRLVQIPAFFNGGKWRNGFFIDKYICSKNGSIASSIKGGRVLSSRKRCDHKETPFSSLDPNISDTFAGAFDAAKTRGSEFFVSSLQMRFALGMLVVAQRQDADANSCKWLDSKHGWPVGCNNWEFGDRRMPGLIYETDDTWDGCGKTGSANIPAAVSHNGHECGVMDLNGIVWEIQSGVGERHGLLAQISESDRLEDFHLNKWSPDPSTIQLPSGGYHRIDPRLVTEAGFADALTDVDCGAGGVWIPGKVPKGLCVLSGGNWHTGSTAGVWALSLYGVRSTSSYYVGFRSASYL